MSEVVHLTTAAFEKALALGSPLLIDFWAPWCGPCRLQGPILDDVAQRCAGSAILAKVNVDEEPRLASRFGIQSIPTLLVIKEGQILNRMVGVQSAEVLTAALQQAGAR